MGNKKRVISASERDESNLFNYDAFECDYQTAKMQFHF